MAPGISEREGGDITASDMIVPEDDSDILEFYKGSTVFITGATGFLGKLCMEKLLRTCKDVKKIYVMMRPKKGKDVQKRFDELFDEPSFDPLKRSDQLFRQKVNVINGDATMPDLGLSAEDKEKLVAEVDCVLHFAATVRFDEKLKTAVHINIRAVRDLLRLAKQMKKLRAFLHVSTAYSNCTRKDIDEKFYEPPMSPEKLLNLVDCLDDEKLNAITTTLLGEYPNTYAFTKCLAEDVVRTEGKNLPVALYRPSIVIATAKEPVAGWIDNLYGATGVLLGAATGVLRVLNCNKFNKSDMVPADFVVNSCLAATWDIARIKSLNDNKETQDLDSQEEKFEKEIPVYNFVSTVEKPMTWDLFEKLSQKHCWGIPSDKVVWHYTFFMVQNNFLFSLLTFLLHTVPAHIVDFAAVCLGKKPLLVKGYTKINKFASVLSFFCLREWQFKNDNIQALWERMKPQDKELFEFSMKNLNWDIYFHTYTRGARVYLLKDPLDTIPQGAVKMRKLKIAHFSLVAIITYFFLRLLMFLFSLFIKF